MKSPIGYPLGMRSGVIASLLVVAILAGAGAGYLVGNENQRTVTSTFTAVSTTTVAVNTTRSSSGLLSLCSHAEAPTPIGLLFGAVSVGTHSPAVICVQFYYFSSVPTTLATSMIIQGVQPNRSFTGDSNFTTSASGNQLLLGGPQNEDEGAVVAFAVTAKPGASGTYELGFSGDYMLTPVEPVDCGYYGMLVAGNGHPFYVFPGGCLTYNTHETATGNLSSVQGIQYPILTNTLFFRVVGVINSTG